MEPDLRISNSPRRSPLITQGLSSPARSVYPQMQQMDSMYSQPDPGMRTTDFFDDTSDDDSSRVLAAQDETVGGNSLERRAMANLKRLSDLPDEPFTSQCEGKGKSPAIKRNSDGYEPLTPSLPLEDKRATAQTPSSSLVGSVDELLPVRSSSPPQLSQRPRNSSGRELRHSSLRIERSADRSSKLDQTLDAYTIAHNITLQALMRNEEALDRGSLAPLQTNDRHSSLQGPLNQDSDPRSPKGPRVSSPSTDNRRVHLIPPPIDTSAPRRSLPSDLVRTPFPVSPEPARRDNFTPRAATTYPSSAGFNVESVLTLSIRRSNPNSQRRVTSLVIPAANEFSAVRSSSDRAKEQHFRALDFDDAAFFERLRKRYFELAGPWRFLSARSLQRIVVSGPAMQEANRGYWIYQPRSPRTLAYKGLKDTFSEERILQHYRQPALGRSRYAFVHWAHRLAAAPRASTPGRGEASNNSEAGDLMRRQEQPEGLEFVVSWSWRRISLALVVVLIIATAAALLWVFLGRSTPAGWPTRAGYRNAGDRVTAGLVMGICLLLLGLSSITGWLGVSWLVM